MEYLVKAQDYLKLKIKDTYRLAHSYRVANIGKEIAEKRRVECRGFNDCVFVA